MAIRVAPYLRHVGQHALRLRLVAQQRQQAVVVVALRVFLEWGVWVAGSRQW